MLHDFVVNGQFMQSQTPYCWLEQYHLTIWRLVIPQSKQYFLNAQQFLFANSTSRVCWMLMNVLAFTRYTIFSQPKGHLSKWQSVIETSISNEMLEKCFASQTNNCTWPWLDIIISEICIVDCTEGNANSNPICWTVKIIAIHTNLSQSVFSAIFG